MKEYYDKIDQKDPRQTVVIPKVDDEEISRFGTMILAFISIILVLVTLPFSLCYCVKVVQEYERAVIFRLGRLKKGGASGPGLFFILPCIDKYSCVDLRTVSYEVPPQEMLSRDSVTVSVDAVCFYKVKLLHSSIYQPNNILVLAKPGEAIVIKVPSNAIPVPATLLKILIIFMPGFQSTSSCLQCWGLHALNQSSSGHKLEKCLGDKGKIF